MYVIDLEQDGNIKYFKQYLGGETVLHIAICDDEEGFISQFTLLLNQWSKETGTEIKISTFKSGLELISNYNPSIELLFLDIQMKVMDGLHTAQRLREIDKKLSIIFLTSLSQYSLEGYKYQADDYIIKPIKYVRLKDEMNFWLKRHKNDPSPFIVINNDKGKYRIILNDIRYIETFNRNLMVHAQDDIICYKTMREMEKSLINQGFCRCHSSYLVNMLYIKRIKKLEIVLTTGEIIPISQPRRKSFIECVTDYWGDHL